MTQQIHVLIVEDLEDDTLLLADELRHGGFDVAFRRVDTAAAMRTELEARSWDVILCDFTMPHFNGVEALKLAQGIDPDAPFIFVSGTIGEEIAIEAMKSGAQDYVMKTNLARLVPAVTRELKEAQVRRQKHHAEQLLNLRTRALEAAANAVVITDRDAVVQWANPAFTSLTGYSAEEIIGKDIRLLKSGKQEISFYAGLWSTILSGKVWHGEAINRRKDATLYAEEMTITPVKGDAGNITHFIAVKQDITERKRLEEQFVQAQKMEVVGRLAGGIAHDFNNILSVIMGYASLSLDELDATNPLRPMIEEIRTAADRATGLTRQLLVFSRKQTLQPVVLDLNEVLGGLNKMLQRLIDESIELIISPGDSLGHVKADSGYLAQVLMNLTVNARDAMPKGGRLKIETANVMLDENYAKTHPNVVPGRYVMLAVTDSGIGMTDDVKAHLFEAFFTTKPKNKGTGLGLATCQMIIKQCGGQIGVHSELGKGTTFEVYLPRVDEPILSDTEFIKASPLMRGTETLLVVEDEPTLRHLEVNILEAQGYTVLRANSGQDGLRVAREHRGEPIRLVITDVVMPLMGGQAMAEWLKATYPDLRILFTSGHTDTALGKEGVLSPGMMFLAKPYTPATLARKVREMLDSPSSIAQTGAGSTP